MQSRPSKLLENLIALGAFDAEKRDHKTHLIDRLFLIMLGQKDCHAVKILRSRLKDWELYQIKQRVEREIERSSFDTPRQDREEFFTGLIDDLGEIAGIWAGAHMAASEASDTASRNAGPNTGHLLLHILASRDSIAGRVLGMYRIMADDVSLRLAEMPDEEMYVSEIRIIRRRELRPEDDDWEPSPDTPPPALQWAGPPKPHAGTLKKRSR